MVRIAVCDDMPEFLEQTKQLLVSFQAERREQEVALFQDADALLAAHAQNPFDIIFLDVVMPLLSGIDAAKELREKDKTVKIVFLTSSAEYAVDSYAVKASNYLLKPLREEAFYACLKELLAELRQSVPYVTVKGTDAVRRVALSEIESVEAQGKRIVFCLVGGGKIPSAEPLYVYEKLLSVEDGFYKCHRSYIVNLHQVDGYSHAEMVMRSGNRIPISRSCQKEFESVFFSVVFQKAEEDLC